MPSVCFYFQLHQPRRLKRYSVFDSGVDYFDEERNRHILRRVAAKCYLPATQIILDQIQETRGAFRVAFSITGTLLDQLKKWEPEVLDQFRKLSETGCVEFLAETHPHSLAFLCHEDEFFDQIAHHTDAIETLFGQRPRVFRNTELIYSDDLSQMLQSHGEFKGILAEGVDSKLAGRSPNHIYQSKAGPEVSLLLKNYRLSDDIAFRFNNIDGTGQSLTADLFAERLMQQAQASNPTQAQAASDSNRLAETINLFMDFETFGEHLWVETGILDFLAYLPKAMANAGVSFKTPTETIDAYDPIDTYICPETTSWADTERDASAWVGNAMQSSALSELYKLGDTILKSGDASLIDDWRLLNVSDHFYYMSTKSFGDGDVHAYFNPYESPYDAYINYMNVMDHLRTRVEALKPAK